MTVFNIMMINKKKIALWRRGKKNLLVVVYICTRFVYYIDAIGSRGLLTYSSNYSKYNKNYNLDSIKTIFKIQPVYLMKFINLWYAASQQNTNVLFIKIRNVKN